MGTTAQRFFLGTGEQDFTAPTEVDIRKLGEGAEGQNNLSICAFGTAIASITIDPFSTRSAVGTGFAHNFGWAVNRSGVDGMASTEAAKRMTLAGTWTFNAGLATDTAVTTTYTITAFVYRVNSAGTRALWASATSAAVTPTALGTQVNWNLAGAAELVLEADQTILVSYAINKVGTTLVAESITFRVAGTSWFDVPTPGVRTARAETGTLTGVGTLARALAATQLRALVGVGTVARTYATVASKSFALTGVGTVAAAKAVALPRPLTGVGTVNGRIEMPIDEVPESGTTAAPRIIRIFED